ncbi:MAG TPA: tRNA uridine-5-carboxymethylaminomethyl(34) synthesis GTPase MnmE [Candidatus Binatia bacterium]|jgi:tRNA modification GTPase
MYRLDTIAAIATPPGEGSIAVIRMSGVDAEQIAAKIFFRRRDKKSKLQSHRLYHGTLRDPKSARAIDEVLLAIMRQPRSYTGEDVIEIHCHGGAFIARRVLQLVLSEGARQAEPGEFTRRAFLNGRLDLSQAEGVLDLIRARTESGAAQALDQASGNLSHWVEELRSGLLNVLVQVEAAIDFPEEEIELLKRHELDQEVAALCEKISIVSSTYEWTKLFRDGAKVCICGRPNVGKSSLLNALVGEQRVIVTPVAGTTRDVIEESINLDGLPVTLWDTAGIHEAADEIERIGVHLARDYLEKSDARIVVIDGSLPLSAEDTDLVIAAVQAKALIAVNKTDLARSLSDTELKGLDCRIKHCRVSAKTGAGVPELKQALRNLVLDKEIEFSPVTITNLRHRSALRRAEYALRHAAKSLSEGFAAEFVAVDLNEARQALEEITGLINSEDILDEIFANFCIGK